MLLWMLLQFYLWGPVPPDLPLQEMEVCHVLKEGGACLSGLWVAFWEVQIWVI